jgi:hypothetical protein
MAVIDARIFGRHADHHTAPALSLHLASAQRLVEVEVPTCCMSELFLDEKRQQ